MRPIQITTDKYAFEMDECGMFRLDDRNPPGPWESGFTGTIKSQEDRVALARFLGEVSAKLATPKAK